MCVCEYVSACVCALCRGVFFPSVSLFTFYALFFSFFFFFFLFSSVSLLTFHALGSAS